MKTAKEMRERYDRLCLEIEALEGVRDTYVKSMQAACDHPKEQVVEEMWVKDDWGYNSTPPFRVCKLCGYSEEGWGSGFKKLKYGFGDDVPTLPYEKARKYQIGQMVRQG
jgi:hypothetical protein